MSRNIYSALLVFVALMLSTASFAGDQHDHKGHDHSHHNHDGHDHDHGDEHGSHDDHGHGGGKYDPAKTAIHHISDGNVWSILEYPIPLPMILKSDAGWDFFMSSKFDVHAMHHEDGMKAYNGYVLHEGSVHRVADSGFPMKGSVDLGKHVFDHVTETIDGKEEIIPTVKYNGKSYKLDARSTWDGGVLGGGVTSFYDLSPTKNVIAMLLVAILLFFLFRRSAKKYKENPLKAPSGAQGLLETMVLFIRDEVAIPFIGKGKYLKYFPFLLSIFFFILGLNLFGQVPFFGSVNATGNLTLTMVLALIVFILVNINGNRHYWQHVFNMPGVPWFVKLILTPVEIMGLFIKPLTLMLRLAGNISAGHIAILSFIGLIFIFGNLFGNVGYGMGSVLGVLLTLFMMAIELIVAFVQAFVFTILTASYIGAATEEHHH